MKKSKAVILGAVFSAALASCQDDQPEWILGNDTSSPRQDTAINGQSYRHYHGGWYPIYHGLICPGYYNRGYTSDEISKPGFAPGSPEAGTYGSVGGVARGVSTGGFGSSGGEGGEGGGE
jgi:hypothetical protein